MVDCDGTFSLIFARIHLGDFWDTLTKKIYN